MGYSDLIGNHDLTNDAAGGECLEGPFSAVVRTFVMTAVVRSYKLKLGHCYLVRSLCVRVCVQAFASGLDELRAACVYYAECAAAARRRRVRLGVSVL